MPIAVDEITTVSAPFRVRFDGKRGKPIGKPLTVEGFSENDPLGVGGGILPDFATVYFKGGGWLLLADLLERYSLHADETP